MVALGLYFILLTLIGVYLWRKGTLFTSRPFLKAALWSLALPLVANELGWTTAEVGRQPWNVHKMLKTSDAVSVTVPAWQVGLSLLVFVVVYLILFVLWVKLIKREMTKGFAAAAATKDEAGEAATGTGN